MAKLGDLYTDFSRIDLDTRGGYARVSRVTTQEGKGLPEFGAFKLMRHELDDKLLGFNRFEGELSTLLRITQGENYPHAVTRVFDSGFVSSRLSEKLYKSLSQVENTGKIEEIDLEVEIISTGTNLQSFLSTKSIIDNGDTNNWLPYLFVELAPYHDNLLRQIRKLSSGSFSDLYWLSIREILVMGLQILDLMDYLHKNHNFAYMDWKPEHIYWNSFKSHLKVIDWNVTNHFRNEREKRLFVREDTRLFCGAALYCSLALNDPEDLKKPIGTKSRIAPNSLFSSNPRYWTNQPIFYDRDFMLDDNIKLIIEYALDPSKGFNTPQELREELIKYADKELGLSISDLSPLAMSQVKQDEIQNLISDAENAHAISEHYRSIQICRRILRTDPENKGVIRLLERVTSELPESGDTDEEHSQEPLQLFRRARSYISAKDYQEAIRILEDAVDIAFKQGVIFREAQLLIDSLKVSIEAEKSRRKIDLALADEKWELASELYKDAINLDSENEVFKREFDSLRNLLKVHSDLQEANLTKKLFSKLRPIQALIVSAKDFLGSTNPLVKSVDKQINQIQTTRIGFTIVLTTACVILFTTSSWGVRNLFPPVIIPTVTVSPTVLFTDISVETSSPTLGTTATILATASPTASETPTPTPALATLGTGYITFGQISSWDSPNGKFIEFLHMNQVVTIIEKTNDHGDDWYRCTWERDGFIKEGWILARYIELGSPPTPRP